VGIQLGAYVTRSVRAIWPLFLLVLLVFDTGIAVAQGKKTDRKETRALELFESAATAFREGRFREAIELLDEANQLKPGAIIHYNKARAYEGLGEKPTALDEYRKYLELDPDATDRGAVEQRIRALEQEISERERLERERLERERLQAERAKAPARPAPRLREPKRPSALPWVIAGAGVVGVGVGVYFGLRARSAESAGETAASQREADENRARAADAATVANVAWIIGGALTLGGGVWGVLDLQATSRSNTRVGVSIAPNRLQLSGRF
jgi:tetratricopeptide (TPR) repeat protein